MDTGIANTWDRIHNKLRSLSSKFDEFLMMFTKKNQVGDESY